MREIKFRMWNGKKMNYSPVLSKVDLFVPLEEIFKNKRYKFMQFTGLYDIAGNEIYEGDILQHPIRLDLINEVKYEAYGFEHDDEGIGFALGHHKSSGVVSRLIIGNIYENPNLIKK